MLSATSFLILGLERWFDAVGGKVYELVLLCMIISIYLLQRWGGWFGNSASTFDVFLALFWKFDKNLTMNVDICRNVLHTCGTVILKNIRLKSHYKVHAFSLIINWLGWDLAVENILATNRTASLELLFFLFTYCDSFVSLNCCLHIVMALFLFFFKEKKLNCCLHIVIALILSFYRIKVQMKSSSRQWEGPSTRLWWLWN